MAAVGSRIRDRLSHPHKDRLQPHQRSASPTISQKSRCQKDPPQSRDYQPKWILQRGAHHGVRFRAQGPGALTPSLYLQQGKKPRPDKALETRKYAGLLDESRPVLQNPRKEAKSERKSLQREEKILGGERFLQAWRVGQAERDVQKVSEI